MIAWNMIYSDQVGYIIRWYSAIVVDLAVAIVDYVQPAPSLDNLIFHF